MLAGLAAPAAAQSPAPPDAAAAIDAAYAEGRDRLAEGRFDLAAAGYARALALSRERHGPRDARTIRLMNMIAIAYLRRDRLAEAERLFFEARDAAEPGSEPLLLTLDNIPYWHLAAGRSGEAEAAFRAVLRERTRIAGENAAGTLLTVVNLATFYVNAGRIAEADALVTPALAIAERVHGPESDPGISVAMVAGQVRAAQGRYAEAEPLLRRLLAVTERRQGPGGRGAVEAGNLLARTLFEAGRHAEAEALYRRITDTSAAALGADSSFTLMSMNGLGLSQLMQGRHAEAERTLAAALAGFERTSKADTLEALQTLMSLATTYQLQSRFAQAEPLMLRAIERGERTLGPDNPNVLLFLSNLAELFALQNRIDEAIPLAERALAGAERTTGPDSPRTLLFVNNIATFLRSAGRIAEALPYLERAFAGRERIYGFDNRDTLLTATTLATVRFQGGRAAEGEALMARIVAASERALGAIHPDTIYARLSLANFYQAQGRLDQAQPHYVRVLADGAARLPASDELLIEAAGALSAIRQAAREAFGDRETDFLTPARQAVAGIRARRATRGGRFGAAQATRELMTRGSYFMLLADALWETGPTPDNTSEAFAALQDAVAGTTDRAVMQMAIRRFADEQRSGLGALVREREELEARWAAAAERQVILLTAPGVTEAERGAVRAEAAEVERRLDAVDAQLREAFPDYFDLANPRAIGLEDAASVLRPDEVLLMIVPGERGTHLLTVTDRGITWRRSAMTRDKLARAVRRLLWQLGGNVTPGAGELAAWSREPAASFDRALAHQLYTELVAPMRAELAGKRHVFVAASGVLAGLPLGVLVTEPPRGDDADPATLRQTRWLADAYALVQVPSVQSMLLLRRFARPGPGGRRFVGFGDPLLDGAAQSRTAAAARGAGMAETASLRSMARLPGTAEELRNMRAALAAPADSIFLGAAATERQVRSMDLSDVGILALATHGLMAGEIDGADEPGLVLTPPAAPTAEDDGYLAASEIAALRINADWVILSACNTASGDGSLGAQGLSGLARAFFYAGARTLLASHWPVRDDVGAALTVRAIQLEQAEPQLSRAEAFQRAMREIRDDAGRDWAHPNAWAPFTLIGDAAR